MDCSPTRWPESPRIVLRCAPRASNGPNHLGRVLANPQNVLVGNFSGISFFWFLVYATRTATQHYGPDCLGFCRTGSVLQWRSDPAIQTHKPGVIRAIISDDSTYLPHEQKALTGRTRAQFTPIGIPTAAREEEGAVHPLLEPLLTGGRALDHQQRLVLEGDLRWWVVFGCQNPRSEVIRAIISEGSPYLLGGLRTMDYGFRVSKPTIFSSLISPALFSSLLSPLLSALFSSLLSYPLCALLSSPLRNHLRGGGFCASKSTTRGDSAGSPQCLSMFAIRTATVNNSPR